ncbi:MAG: argininosuccinate synthase [Flavobacteriaceae bacterium]|nr:argininosuccinate synthase [Flavobacteriaceae bacterium]
MSNKKVVLAFSGGLDTSYCAIYLSKILNLEVHAVIVNTGGFTEIEINEIEQKANYLGVASFCCIDETNNYYDTVIKYLIFGNVLKNNTYPLSVSAERISQATSIANYAKSINAAYVAHGSTGAGNDQVRFDAIFNILIPTIQIITPIRDQKLSRAAEIEFLKENDIEINAEKAKYSINKGLWGTSVGGKETLTSHLALPEEAYPTQVTKTTPLNIELYFEKGELKMIDGQSYTHPTEAIMALENIAAPFGIGRDIHVGDTIIGIKGRVGFEAAAAIIIIKAHHVLEKHTLTKLQLMIKDQQAMWYGSWLHEGLFLDPIMRDLEAFLTSTQKKVTGKVFVKLSPYSFSIIGIESKHDLMSNQFGSYGEMNNSWSGEDVKGYTKIMSNQMSIYHQINKDE